MSGLEHTVSRRRLLGMGLTAAAAAALAACGGAASPTAAPAKPTEAPKPAAAAATTAPAASGGAASPAAAATTAPSAGAASPAAAAATKPAAGAASPVAGASGAASPAAASSGASAPAAAMHPEKAKGATLKLLVWSSFKYDGIKTYQADFEKETGAKLQFDPVSSNDLANKQVITFSAGTGEYDISSVDEPYLPAYSGFLLELDPLIAADKFPKEDWIPVMWEAGTFNGKQYMMPFDPNVQILFYRKDLLDAKGLKPPTTWTEYMDVAQKVQTPEVSGSVMMAKRDDQTGINAWNFITTFGDEIFDDKFQAAFDNQKAYDGLQLYKDIIDKVSPKGVTGFEYEDVNANYRQGKSALLQQWASIAPGVKTSKDSVVFEKTAYAMPVGQEKRHSMRGVWSWGIVKDSKNRDAAWEWDKWFTTPENMLKYVKAGSGNSPRLSVLNSQEFLSTFPHAQALADTFKIAKKRPIFKEYGEILVVLDVLGSNITTGQQKPQEAVKEAAGKLNEIMKRGGYVK